VVLAWRRCTRWSADSIQSFGLLLSFWLLGAFMAPLVLHDRQTQIVGTLQQRSERLVLEA
jgi:hypothetical protein